jgi:hypothetical protein
MIAAFSPLAGFRSSGSIPLADSDGVATVLKADDQACLAELAALEEVCRGSGTERVAPLVERIVRLSRCPFCGGDTFARTLKTRFHRRRTNIVVSDQLHCISGRAVVDDEGQTVRCSHRAIVVRGVARGLDPSPAVIRASQAVLRASFTPMEEAQHRGIVVGRWSTAGDGDDWTDDTHDGTLAPRCLPPTVSAGLI